MKLAENQASTSRAPNEKGWCARTGSDVLAGLTKTPTHSKKDGSNNGAGKKSGEQKVFLVKEKS